MVEVHYYVSSKINIKLIVVSDNVLYFWMEVLVQPLILQILVNSFTAIINTLSFI